MKIIYLITLSYGISFAANAQQATPINDSTELQQFDNGEHLKVSYLLNGIPISLKDKKEITDQDISLKQEFNIKNTGGETLGEINLITDDPGFRLKKEKAVSAPRTINIFNEPLRSMFPTFEWTDIQGNKLSSASLLGKTVVLNFWHSSCIPCIAEMPQLNELVKQYAGKDVIFIASSPNTAGELKKFLTKKMFAYTQVAEVDPLKIFNPMPGWPIHIVFDGSGIVRFAVLGKQDSIEKKLSKAIEESLTYTR